MKKGLIIALPIISLIIIGIILYFSLHYSTSPARLRAVIIKPVNCTGCYNMTPVLDQAGKLNARITSIKEIYYPKDISKEELLRMNITRLPVLVISGQPLRYPQLIDFWDMLGARIDKKFLKQEVIIQPPEPVYYNLLNDSVYGYVNIIEIKPPDCKVCNNMSRFREMISHLCYISQYLVADYNTELAQGLIEKYNITRLPAVILSPEAKEYKLLNMKWENIGIIEKDNYLVSTQLTPPFYSIPENRVVGLVNLTYLYDPNCIECYDYNLHRATLERFYVKIVNESLVDIHSKEGRRLIEKYNITAIPTFIASPDLKYYKELMNIWDQVGTIEPDGFFVFRNMGKMPGRIYLDLETNETRMGG